MPLKTRFFLIMLVLVVGSTTLLGDESIVFDRDIRPILSNHCYRCHGPDEASREGDLRLDTEEGSRKTLGTPGGKSELLSRVMSTDPDLLMPPPDVNKPLDPRQIDLLTRWISAGASWGSHWAFEPLVFPGIPNVVSGKIPLRNPIDHFVQARLSARGVVAREEATRATLIRRVTLDLTGLPPTKEEVDLFVSDSSNDAYEKVVDRLLMSPAYGERMAWNWLDAARYADSNGYQGDNERTMWPWRDWVIDAFNRNLPWNDFTVWQLAGDQLPDATFEQKLATGFCRNHMINGEGGRIPEENRVDYVMDMSETAGTVWLGLTMNCCRCHDHKFDPLTQRDYYRLFAFFNQTPVDGGGGNPQTPPILEAPGRDQSDRLEEIEIAVSGLNDRLQLRTKDLGSHQHDWEKQMLETNGESSWWPLTPVAMTALHQTLNALDDGSILASGENPANDTYSLTMKTDAEAITALRIDAIRHESHTHGGLSRSDSGNFVLTGVEIAVQRPGEDTSLPVKIASGEATFEQGSYKITGVFDADPQTGWAVYEGRPVDRDHSAILRLAEPIVAANDVTLTIRLRHDSPHVSHNTGRFRLSTTSEPQPQLQNDNAELFTALHIPDAKRTAEQRAKIEAAHQAADTEYTVLVAERDKLNKSLADLKGSFAKVMVMQDKAELRKTFILTRGLYSKPGDEVTAGVPQEFAQLPDGKPANRLALARWLVSDENPLTARVTVNRFWQQFFGIGLVKTTEDFGIQGDTPVHQDLLNWLAADFRQHNWDVKRLIRQIVTSHTYRQSSAIAAPPSVDDSGQTSAHLSYEDDPENRLLSRAPRFRLPSFMIRDQALAASGLLVTKIGGPPVRGYQPAGVWEETTFGRKQYQQDHGEALYRRSLYTFWRRIIAPTMFFDNASRQTCTVKMFRTNTPLHALLTLNDVTFVEAARAMAERVLLADFSDDAVRIDDVFRRLLARKATEQEQAILQAAITRSRREFQEDPDAALKLLAVGESKRNEELDGVEHAAWTGLALAVMNLDEVLTKE